MVSGYGRLCEALPVFPCGADVLAPIGQLTVIGEVDLNEYVVREASEGEQKAVLVESNRAVLFARPWGALVNQSEELFQLVKIVTAALLVLEALCRQLGYGRLNCEPRYGAGPGGASTIKDDEHDLTFLDFRLGSNIWLIRHCTG